MSSFKSSVAAHFSHTGTPERESSRLTAAAIMTPVLFRYHQLRESYFDKDLAIVVS